MGYRAQTQPKISIAAGTKNGRDREVSVFDLTAALNVPRTVHAVAQQLGGFLILRTEGGSPSNPQKRCLRSLARVAETTGPGAVLSRTTSIAPIWRKDFHIVKHWPRQART
ncbi:MAG: integrase domain-containing protein [Rudaea sp.]|nr:integrase domain-containing protein [Rudaea sp.]MBR0345306.1 integrase domain-containing protein [Rudaea sp.]